MSIILLVAVAVIASLFLLIRRDVDPRRVVDSLSPADRDFLADQLEGITRLPLRTAEDEDAWYATTRETQRRLREHFSDAAVVPHRFTPYFNDPDIHRKDPAYRAAQEKPIIDFIAQLRERT